MKGVVLDIKKNSKGYFGFIKYEEGKPNIYFNNFSVVPGHQVRKGSVVNFSIRKLPDGQVKAINVALAEAKQMEEQERMLIEDTLRSLLEETGAADCILVVQTLQNMGINYEDYAANLTIFIRTLFGNVFTIRKDVRAGGKLYEGALVWAVSPGLPVEVVEKINAGLQAVIREKGACIAADFPQVLQNAGVDSYKLHADTIEEFIRLFLAKRYKYEREVPVDGNRYPAVVAIDWKDDGGGGTGHDDPAGKDSPSDELDTMPPDPPVKEELKALDALYAQGAYAAFLSSPVLERIPPSDLPISYMEKALTCAMRLMYPERKDTIWLNVFQMELIRCPSIPDFMKKWKNSTGFDQRILEACVESALPEFELPRDVGMVSRLINNLGSAGSLNNNYAGITRRFSICENSLVPYLFVVRAFVMKSQTALQSCLTEYGQFVKDMITSSSRDRVRKEDKLYSFPQVLLVLQKHLMKDMPMNQSMRTNVISVFYDTGSVDVLKGIIEQIIPEPDANERKLMDLIYNSGRWTEEMLFRLIADKVSTQLLQKSIAVMWEQHPIGTSLPLRFLRLLSWIVKYDGFVCIEEIMRYRFCAGYTKSTKKNMLIDSLDEICAGTAQDPSLYALASYVALQSCAELPDEALVDEIKEKLSRWERFSPRFFEEAVAPYRVLTPENTAGFVKLFTLFRLDTVHETALQERYADWYTTCQWNPGCGVDETERALDELFAQGAYDAYVRVYTTADRTALGDLEKRSEEYTLSMVALHRYTELIDGLLHDKLLSKEQRGTLLIRAVSENFRENALSAKAFSIFGEAFSCEDAIGLILENFMPSRYAAITALIGLYHHCGEYTKAVYLYHIFRSKTESGFHRFYSQYRSQSEWYRAKIHNHYDAIQFAFTVLHAEALVSFLQWTRLIPVPEFKGYNPIHVFAFHYNILLRSVESSASWTVFWNHLIRKLDKNAWQICVCECVLRDVLHYSGPSNSRAAFRTVMDRQAEEPLPPSFLPYAFSYIMHSPDPDLAARLVRLLKNEDCYKRLISENPWYPGYGEIFKKFKSFCLEQYDQTADSVYFDLMTTLGMELDQADIERLSQTGADKQYLFAQICRNYLDGRDTAKMMELLFVNEWKQLSASEAEVLALLRMLYGDDEALLTERGHLFPSEESVARFKQDCAKVLLHYPRKTGLFEFDANCSNPAHRYLVFSYTFGILYDEDIYDRYVIHYPDFGSRREFMAFLGFLRSAYIAQLEKNNAFHFFYKKWRYLKLYINSALQYGVQAEDGFILDIMESYNHVDAVYQNDYLPFREDVKQFLAIEELSLEAKECCLYGLMVGMTGDFLSLYGNELLTLSEAQKDLCKRLADRLDYRETNRSLYELYLPAVREGGFDFVLAMADIVSDYAYDTLTALRASRELDKAFKLVSAIALADKPSECVNKIMRLEDSVFFEYADILVPLMCSRQFRFHLYGRLRLQIISKGKTLVADRYEMVTRYLEEKGSEGAADVCHYLRALHACVNEDAQGALEVVTRHDIEKGVPGQWQTEAERIRQYAQGKTKMFTPDRSVMDNSQEGKRRTVGFSFVRRLQGMLGIDRRSINAEAAVELYEKFRATKADAWEKFRTGMMLLCNYPKLERDSPFKKMIPSRETLALEVGLEITSSGVNLSVDEQLSVVAELFQERSLYGNRSSAELMTRLHDQFAHLLRKHLSLQTWTRHAGVIEEYLFESRGLLDFKELRTRILAPCEQVFAPECSREQRYETLTALCVSFQGLESAYAKNVLEAINRELRRLEESIRLRIDIVNEDEKVTDGHVYFQIENVGRRRVSLAGEDICVICKVENQPETRVEIKNITDLRSGFVTGGRRRLNMAQGDTEVEVTFSIVFNSKSGERIILCQKTKVLHAARSAAEFRVMKNDDYYIVAYAVPGSKKLYGRDGVKEELARCIPRGVTVLYGPSRIGKTSLMNWVRKDLAVKQGNVMSVLYGGEHGLGKESDYKDNFVDESIPIPYDDDKEMAEYLLAQTIIQGILGEERLSEPSQADIPAGLLGQIVEVLGDRSRSISARYKKMNKLLSGAGLELWILLDEFQQVVERWKPRGSCDFVKVCEKLADPDEDSEYSRIKLVVCGSDDLLRHMVLENNSVWRTAFRTRIAVNPLDKQPFIDMIREEPALIGTNIRYSDPALNALYTYTDGVALYGKKICNAVINDIHRNPRKYASRNIIYISDIAEATQNLLEQQASELDTKAKEGIREIYDAVTKNLDDETDKQYLWYMAQWIHDNPEYDGFPERIFTGRKLVRGPEKLRESLEIAMARGIIKPKPSEYEGGKVYVFRTVFYYFAFLGSAGDKLDEDMIFLRETDESGEEGVAAEEVNPYDFANIIKEAPNFSKMYTLEQQKAILGAFATTSTKEALEAFKLIFGVTNNNTQINIQQITATLQQFSAGSLTGSKLLESISGLPRLDAYYTPDAKLAAQDPVLEGERMEHGIDAVANIYADGVRPVIDQAGSEGETDYSKYHVRELLGLDERGFDDLTELLDDWGYEQLRLAMYLHHMFRQAQSQDPEAQIDYSPVSIMYCKLLEAMLKEHHAEGYAKVFEKLETNVSVRDRWTGAYSKLTYSALMTGKYQHRITIGTFTYPLRDAANRELLGNHFITRRKQPTTADWEIHRKTAEDILQIRNQSAHGQKDHRITAQQQEELTRLLFTAGGGELTRIRELVMYEKV